MCAWPRVPCWALLVGMRCRDDLFLAPDVGASQFSLRRPLQTVQCGLHSYGKQPTHAESIQLSELRHDGMRATHHITPKNAVRLRFGSTSQRGKGVMSMILTCSLLGKDLVLACGGAEEVTDHLEFAVDGAPRGGGKAKLRPFDPSP